MYWISKKKKLRKLIKDMINEQADAYSIAIKSQEVKWVI